MREFRAQPGSTTLARIGSLEGPMLNVCCLNVNKETYLFASQGNEMLVIGICRG